MKECCREYMLEQFGSSGVAEEIYGEYVSSVDAKMAEAGKALSARDWTALDRVAHTVKGNALAVGDTEMSETAIELRKKAALSDEAGARALLARIGELRALL
ncbi:MAG: Hpt domain-containing protein [Kiritimatiellae bacterium]|nr:Hpt domain-containing protein [Kiritimatiellia bacterium]